MSAGKSRKFFLCVVAFLLLALSLPQGLADASHHFTERQMDALATRVGKTFWLKFQDGRVPAFVSAPSATAAAVRPRPNESFVITDLAGRTSKNPYYAVRFESGQVGYILPEAFHEALNLTILSIDPGAGEKEKTAQRELEEKERVEWIQAQPWSPVIKQAAIKRQPAPGLTTGEVKRVMGEPQRITKLGGPLKLAEEHWFYPDGSVLIFHNELLSKVERK